MLPSARRWFFVAMVSEQSLYTLNARTTERDLIPAVEACGLGLIPWSLPGGGFLGEMLSKQTEGRRAGMAEQVEKDRPKLEAWVYVRPTAVAYACQPSCRLHE